MPFVDDHGTCRYQLIERRKNGRSARTVIDDDCGPALPCATEIQDAGTVHLSDQEPEEPLRLKGESQPVHRVAREEPNVSLVFEVHTLSGR
jgi:hypothetical protein